MTTDDTKTKAELIQELERLRQENADLKRSVATQAAPDSTLRRLFDHAPLPYHSLDEFGRILAVNKTWLQFMGGYAHDEVLGRWVGDFMAPDSSDMLADRFSQFKATGTVTNAEFIFVRKDGTKVLTSVCGKVTQKQDGSFDCTHCLLQDVTDSRSSELALLESELKFRNLFESSREGIVYTTPDGCILDFNPSFAAMVGRTTEELQGVHVNDIMPARWHPLNAQIFAQLLANGFIHEVQEEIYRADGTLVPISLRVWLIHDDDGKPVGAWAMVRDFSQQQEAIRTEARYQLLADNIADVIWTLDNDFRLTYVSPSITRLRGLTPEEALGENLRDTMTPDSYERTVRSYQEWLASEGGGEAGRTIRTEIEQYRKDGSTVWTECVVRPMFSEQGLRTGMIGISRDISDRKEAEAALKESEDEYRLIMETANDGIWILDKDDRTIFTNQALQDMLGYTAEEMAWRNVRDFIAQDEIPDMQRRKEARIKGLSERYERRLQHRDGHTLWCQASTSPFLDRDGNFSGTVGMIRDISENKRTEEALRMTQFSVDNASVPIMWMNAKGRFTYVNQMACDLHGYTKEEFLRLSVPDVNPDFDLATWPAYWEERRKQSLKTFETAHRRKDGSSFPVDITSHCQAYMGQEMIFTYAFDLTQRKQAEEELRRSRKLLEEVQQLAQSGGWEINTETNESYWTEGQYQLFGLDPEQPPPDFDCTARHYVVPEERAAFLAYFNQLHETPGYSEFEHTVVLADGAKAVYKTIAAPELDSQGCVRRIYGSTRNITKERLAKTELLRSHQRLLNILDSIDAEIYVSDLNTYEVLFVNRRFREIYGDRVPGKPCWAQIKKGTGPCSFCKKPDLIGPDGVPVDTIVWENQDPMSGRWLLNHDRAIQWLEGRMVHMQVAQDITERKELETKLKLAKTAAETASQSKTEFLANMSHEIRTPLNGLLGMIQLLQLTSPTPTQLDYLDTAMISGRNLLQILNDILDLSKIESGKLELYEQEFHLDDLLRSAVDVFRHTASQQGIQCDWQIDENDPMELLGDVGRIRQILFNLVGNAVKFTERGSVRVHGSVLTRCADNRTRLLFSVSDTGIGIANDKLDTIFDPFTQVDGSFTRKYQGTGLGLGIVRRLVRLMNGNISIESELGKGTTITFCIETRLKSEPRQEENTEGTVMSTNQYHLLIAEDEAINQIVATRLLQKLGHTSMCVSDGERVLEALKTGKFDCILMDIQMPGKDGIEITEIIRKELKSSIPIIALTAHAMHEDQQRFIEAGMNGFISKPFELGNLKSELHRVLEEGIRQ